MATTTREKQLCKQKLEPLETARRWFPGPPPSMSSMYRYIAAGVRGEVLQTLLLRGRRVTSREEVERFVVAVSKK